MSFIRGAGGGGGGCFAAGTLISTVNGSLPIEDIKVGDSVVTFNDKGDLQIGVVERTLVHPCNDIYEYIFWGGRRVFATPNHWVLQQYGVFAEIGTLTVEDCIVDDNGHLRPLLHSSFHSNGAVYNLIVSGWHTFIANGLRVHNGGRGSSKVMDLISGSGGGGGGGKGGGGSSHVATEDPNTLRSKSIGRFLDLISEGEIEGLTNGAKSIYFDDTPLMASDGTLNFQGVEWDYRVGTNTQAHMSGFPAVESEVAVGTEITASSSVTRTINDPDADYIRVAIRTPAMTEQDATNGDLHGSTVTLNIEVKPYGGSFSTVLSPTISGKTTSPYEVQYRVDLPSGGYPWDVRVSRSTPDATASNVNNKTYWSTYTRVIDHKLSYPDCAYVGITIDAQHFGGTVPVRSYDIKGIKIKVPSNYNPVTRVYTGIWDGTFQVAWSDNPAWVLYDLITNERYGLGEFVRAEQVDKWSLYTISQYCDELVSDGFGGTEPRFTINCVLASREEAFRVVQSIASAFRGMACWASGLVYATQDSPVDIKTIVTNANVVDGRFKYAGSAIKARHTAALVTWNDPDDGYRASVEVVEAQEAINTYGWRQTDVIAFGCTSRGQAHRFGKWILDSAHHETDTVTFTVSFDQINTMPGDLVGVFDKNYIAFRRGGRIVTATTTEITLDQAVTIDGAYSYTLYATLPDGTPQGSVVTNSPGTYTVLNLETPLTATPINGAIWGLSGTDVSYRPFRVIAIREKEKHLFEVTALFHDTTKFARVEENIIFDPPEFSLVPKGELLPPTDMSLIEYLYAAGPQIKAGLTIGWSPSSDPRTAYHEVQVQRPGRPYENYGVTSAPTMEVTEVTSGTYSFRVRALDHFGRFSKWIYLENQVVLGLMAPPSDVTLFNINVMGDTTYLSWSPVTDLDVAYYTIKYNNSIDGSATWGSSFNIIDRVSHPSTSVALPTISGTFLIKAVDSSGKESRNATIVVSTVANLSSMEPIGTITEHPGFVGDKNACTIISNQLQLDSVDTLSDWTSLADVSRLLLGINGLSPVGYYYFSDFTDLGEVHTTRISASMVVYGQDYLLNMISWTTLASVDRLEGTDPSTWGAKLQLRKTNDDPVSATWGSWQDFTVGDYSARAFEYRLVLTSTHSTVTPIVSFLQINADMKERMESGQDVTVPDTGLDVTFNYPFLFVPAILANGQDIAVGTHVEITNQSTTGFTLKFKNSGGYISGSADWAARGYGQLII